MEPTYYQILENKIKKPAVLDTINIDDKTTMITRVSVPKEHRGKGVGTSLLKEAIEDADRECRTLLIEPLPYSSTQEDKTRLIKLYTSLGFVEREHDYMIRKPKCK